MNCHSVPLDQIVFLDAKDTVRCGLEKLMEFSSDFAIVIDGSSRLVGVVSDFDIRKGLSLNVSLEDPIESVFNSDPITLNAECSDVEVRSLMMEKKIMHLPLVDNDGRVVSLASLRMFPERKKLENGFVIMAGGKGTRLSPLTDGCPKALVKVAGIPMIERIIGNAKNVGFSRFIICVNHLAEKVISYLGDGDRLGVSIEYIHEDRPLGTAGALYYLKDMISEPFMVSNCDVLTEIDYFSILNLLMVQRVNAVLAVGRYVMQNPFGTISLDDQGSVSSFIEKPRYNSLVNYGIYAFSADVLDSISSIGPLNMNELVERVIKKGRVSPYFIHEEWFDVGRLADHNSAVSYFEGVD